MENNKKTKHKTKDTQDTCGTTPKELTHSGRDAMTVEQMPKKQHEAPSRNHFCRGEAISITQSECLFVA